ncbi:MarR family transcriptional regulator [uncultured Maribacter sp.]|uniref:MarR family winged helix-turn-helix transcriptional regulator n=1 Tax=uncultured Maribacter sp. TaxID=431308 RepID=UPI00260CF3FC|nr:MarR family transcriptional regulator [uncultured Maribacter sp.]
MNIEKILKTDKEIPIDKRTVVHVILVSHKINEVISQALKPYDVSIQQFNVLRILRGQNGKPANLGTINERMVTKMSNTTRLVDKLIAKNYVERKTCAANRRKIEISITSNGKKELEKIDITMAETENKLVANFSKKELETLNQLLDKF